MRLGVKFTPACKHLNPTWTGPNNLRIIDSPHGVFDPELKQQTFAEERTEEE